VNGNTETTQSTAFQIDTTAPSTTATLAGTLGNSPWYVSAVTVTLSASDATSGVGSTSYKLDGGTFQTYSGSFSVSGNASHTVSFFSVDVAGNTESTSSTSFQIDTTAPTTTATLAGTAGNSPWYVSAVTVTLNAT